MSSGHTITIAPTEAHVEVRLAGAVLADTTQAMRLEETGLPARYYLPKDDVRMDLMYATTFHTTCPFKGEASYWSLDLDGEVLDGVVWSYEAPIPAAEAIAGLMSFYPERVELQVGPSA